MANINNAIVATPSGQTMNLRRNPNLSATIPVDSSSSIMI